MQGECDRVGLIFLLSLLQYKDCNSQKQSMECSIHHLTYNYASPQKIKQLNLTSGSNIKIYQIKDLDDFLNLRVLVLTNNMISVMEGFDKLLHLRVLNLEFNRIKTVEGTQTLSLLEELYLGYNEIETITDTILSNTKLTILHLAFNDIKTLDSLSPLYKVRDGAPNDPTTRLYYLSALTTLSLHGNPITSAINYLTFFKMLIPSLRHMDDKKVDDDLVIMGDVVCPQEEVIILREAINKLLDERNEAVQQLETFLESPMLSQQMKENQSKYQNKPLKAAIKSQEQQEQKKKGKLNQGILSYLESTKKKYELRVKYHRERISKISQVYTENLKISKNSRNQYTYDDIEEEKELKQQISYQSEKYPFLPDEGWCQKNKEIIKQLKLEDEKLQETQQKITNINKLLEHIQRQADLNQTDIYKIILEVVLFGYKLKDSLTVSDCSKLCKRYLIKPSVQAENSEEDIKIGLIEYSEILKKVIFGENNENSQKIEYHEILKLKNKIRSKGLLEIIAQLKQLNVQECAKYSKFERDKKEFIDRFQKQSQELSLAWDELKREKEKYKTEKQRQLKQSIETVVKREQELRRKYKAAEEEERSKILELKKVREKLEDDLERIKYDFTEAQDRLNRKFLELEQFQAHFNQFIDEKEHIKSLEEEINQITNSLAHEQEKYQSLVDKVRQLTLEQGILQNKLIKITQSLKQKQQDLANVEVLKSESAKLYDKYKNQTAKQSQKLRDITNEAYAKIEELKDYQKQTQRVRKNLGLLEQKVRNIEQIEDSKKGNIKQLEEEIKRLKEDKQALTVEAEGLQKKMQGKREQLLKYQLKIQQNRLSMANLSDINKSISDMMIRQSELKRSIIELEIENKNLLEMRNNLVDDYRIKNYL